MFLKVKNYESYIDFYPGTDIPKEVFESGKTFEIQEFYSAKDKNRYYTHGETDNIEIKKGF